MAKSQKLVLENLGMLSNVGDLQQPTGAMLLAQNVDFPTLGLLQTRRGFNNSSSLGATYTNSSYRMVDVFSNPIWNSGKGLVFARGTVDSSGGIVSHGLYWSADGTASGAQNVIDTAPTFNVEERFRVFNFNKSTFFVGKSMTYRISDTWSTTSYDSAGWAGMPRAPGIAYEQWFDDWLKPDPTVNTNPAYWLPDGYGVAYRCTFVDPDENPTSHAPGFVRESAPSGRIVVANINGYTGWVSGSNAAPVLNFQLPKASNDDTTRIPTTGWKIRVYRTRMVDLGQSTLDDEMQLCHEAYVPGGAGASIYSFTDYTPEIGLGAYLYTNSLTGDVGTGLVMSAVGSDGITVENDRPPYAKDGTVYSNCAFYANYKTLNRITLSWLLTGLAGDVIKDGDTFNINGLYTFTFKDSPSYASGGLEIPLYDTATISLQWDLRRTVEATCAAINHYAFNNNLPFVATPLIADTGAESLGKFMIESTVQGSLNPASLNLGTVPVTAVSPAQSSIYATADTVPNGLAISKPYMPDAVPPSNYTTVGSQNNKILRIVSTTDTLFIFLQRGIWTCTGTGPSNFFFKQFDTDFRLLTSNTIAQLGDSIYAWSQNGIARISYAGGIEYIDINVRNLTQSIAAQATYLYNTSQIINQMWVDPQPQFNRVLFWFANKGLGSGLPSAALVYHVDTKGWTLYNTANPDGSGQSLQMLGGCFRQFDNSSWFCSYNALSGSNWTALCQTNETNYSTSDFLFNTDVIMTWATNTPNPNGLCHWSEFEVYSSSGTLGFDLSNTKSSLVNLPVVSSDPLDVTIVSDLGKTTEATINQPGVGKGRIYMATSSGLATRQNVTVTGTGYYAFTGFSFIYRQLSTLNTR